MGTVLHVLGQQFSRLLGLVIISASFLLKVPQLRQVFLAKSVYGISLSAILFETAAYLLHTLYNVAFGYAPHTWAEAAAIGMQNLLLLYLFTVYSKSPSLPQFMAGLGVMIFFSLSYLTVFPRGLQVLLQLAQSPISLYSRVPQLIQNHQNKTTGHLNFTTYSLKFVGTLARVFTSIVSVGDWIIIATAVLSAFLNGALVFQFFQYPPATAHVDGGDGGCAEERRSGAQTSRRPNAFDAVSGQPHWNMGSPQRSKDEEQGHRSSFAV